MYSIDRRKIAIHLYSLLCSLRKTAILMQVSHSTICRWSKSIDRKIYTRSPSRIFKSDIIVAVIKTAILNDPFVSILTLRDMIFKIFSIKVSKELIRVAIRKQGYTKKKANFYGVSNKLPEKTEIFIEQRNKFIRENKFIVSIDEVSFGRNGKIIKGYSKKGTKLFVRKNIPRVTTTSVVACVSKEGLIKKHSTKGAFNTIKFIEFLQDLNLPNNTVILLDNVSFHHSKQVTEFSILNKLELLFVPPYSHGIILLNYVFLL
jgi:hypothetical protein